MAAPNSALSSRKLASALPAANSSVAAAATTRACDRRKRRTQRIAMPPRGGPLLDLSHESAIRFEPGPACGLVARHPALCPAWVFVGWAKAHDSAPCPRGPTSRPSDDKNSRNDARVGTARAAPLPTLRLRVRGGAACDPC